MSAIAAAAKTSSGRVAPHVAIIGGGAAGLAAARVLTRDVPNCAVTVLEKHPTSLGGVWKYEADPTRNQAHPMYRGLRTNLPKEIMAYRELPWHHDTEKDGGEERSYMTHEQVLEYLKTYARHFDLEKMITFGSKVEQLTVLPGTWSIFQPSGSSEDQPYEDVWPQIRLDWTTTTNQNEQHTAEQTKHCQVFDAVCICNGHYSLPATPYIPGLEEYFTGTVVHSIAYDNPSDFAGQTVVCIGGRASGADIARELALPVEQGGGGAKHVYLSDTSCPTTTTADNNDDSPVSWVPQTVAVLPDGSIQFGQDDDDNAVRQTATDVDCIVFCTGYDYQFDFVNSNSNCPLEASERRVQPLYEQLWHAHYPNLAFVGLPHSVLPFPVFEAQAEACAGQWRVQAQQQQLDLQEEKEEQQQQPPVMMIPSSRKERLAAAERDAVSGGKTAGRVPNDTHLLSHTQWDYFRTLAQYAGRLDTAMLDYVATNQAIYDHSGQEKKAAVPGSPDAYRETIYRRNFADQSYTIVKSIVEDEAAASVAKEHEE